MAHVVIVGGGVAGLALALFAARRGHTSTVVDRDAGPPTGPPDTVAGWERRGVAQAHFSHGYPARSSRVLREEAPDVLAAFDAAGIGTTDRRFGPGYEDDRVLASRRTVYEAVLRGVVAMEPGVTIVHGSVVGLVATGAPVEVRGVRLADGREFSGDVVVDAGGRRSAAPRWLAEVGAPPPHTVEHPVGQHYLCRHYRLRDGLEYPFNDMGVALLPYLSVLNFVGDNRTFSIAMGASSQDPYRRRLQDPDVFERVLAAIPSMAEWTARAEPITDVRVMAGLANRRRRLTNGASPPASGLFPLGDAAVYTNPMLGQGISLGFWTAQTLARRLDAAASDPLATLQRYEDWIEDELGSWYRRQLAADDRTRRQLTAGITGAGFLPPTSEDERYVQGLLRLMARDEEVARLGALVGNLLVRPDVYQEPALRARVLQLLDEEPLEPPPVALERGEFERLVTA